MTLRVPRDQRPALLAAVAASMRPADARQRLADRLALVAQRVVNSSRPATADASPAEQAVRHALETSGGQLGVPFWRAIGAELRDRDHPL